MTESGSILTDLEKASKEHEHEVVIEFGTDRLIKWLGVYALAFLAVVAKIGELAAASLTCYPANMTSGPDRAFIEFARDYCWTGKVQENATSSPSCRSIDGDQQILLENANNLKLFLKWLPYVMLAQAFLLSLPIAYWHFRVGARLVGHLKFMQLLLIEIFEQVKTIKSGYYTNEKPYDASGANFDGWKSYPDKTHSSALSNVGLSKPEASPKAVSVEDGDAGVSTPLVADQKSDSPITPQVEKRKSTLSRGTTSDSKKEGTPVRQQVKRLNDWCSRMAPWNIADGEMKDRHFFSMLCFENFASLHHLPYILSVFKVCGHTEDQGKAKKDTNKFPLLESMLLIWCDPKNLADVFLLRVYARKQLSIAFLSLAMLLALLAWFFADVMYDIMLSDTFWCEIPYQSVCMLCAVKRINDTLMLFTIDVTITLIVFALAVWKWLDVQGSFCREAAHFFDVLQKDNNLALQIANYQAKKHG